MVTTNLSERLLTEIEAATELWISVALLTGHGLKAILNGTDFTTPINLIVGIDLPTSIEALEDAFEAAKTRKLNVYIYKNPKAVFHPKCYLIIKGDRMVAFIGSANLTNGGLSENIEISIEMHDQQVCNELKKWTQELLDKSYPLTKENLTSYREYATQIAELEQARKTVKQPV